MRGTRNDSVTVLEEFYPTPSDIPAGTRCLTLHIPDSAEWYGLAVGALWELMRWQNYEKGGIDVDLTIDQWLEVFNTMEVTCMDVIPVGATMMWHMVAPPDRWLFCNGAMVAKADYPELWALWGDTFGASTPDLFAVLNMTDRSPYGQSGFLNLNAVAGALTHTLTEQQIPAHTHPPLSPSTTFLGNKPGATNTMPASTFIGTSATTGATGGGQAHNNLHPVIGVNFIVYGGRSP
jgi:microcystin-dependent protein